MDAVQTLRDDLRALRDMVRSAPHGGASELHVLSLAASSRLGLYDPHAATGALRRTERADALAQLETAAAQWREQLAPAGADAARTARELQELGTQAAELAHARQGVRAMTSEGSVPESLPPALYVGTLAGGTHPCDDRDAALQVLDALCQALVPAATRLRLECFQERTDMPDVATDVVKTHTFTSGGRIVVLDLELGLLGPADGPWAPHVGLQISFAAAEAAHPPSDPRLAEMLRTLVEQLLRELFGGAAASVDAAKSSESSDTPYARATRRWCMFLAHLATLASIDRLDATSSDGTALDAFALLQELGDGAVQLSEAEARRAAQQGTITLDDSQPCAVQPSAQAYLTRYGPGMARQHHASPYLTLEYAPAHHATVHLAPSALSWADGAHAPDTVPVPHGAHHELDATLAASHGARVPLTLVAQLSPAVVVPHALAADVYHACGLAPAHERGAHDTRPTGSGYVALMLSHAPRFRAAAQDDDVRVVSALPCRSMAHMYHALSVLQAHIRLQSCFAAAHLARGTPLVTVQWERRAAPGAAQVRLSAVVPETECVVNAVLAAPGAPGAGEAPAAPWTLDATASSPTESTAPRLWEPREDDAVSRCLRSTELDLGALADALVAWAQK